MSRRASLRVIQRRCELALRPVVPEELPDTRERSAEGGAGRRLWLGVGMFFSKVQCHAVPIWEI